MLASGPPREDRVDRPQLALRIVEGITVAALVAEVGGRIVTRARQGRRPLGVGTVVKVELS